jgi:VWFA-related protein
MTIHHQRAATATPIALLFALALAWLALPVGVAAQPNERALYVSVVDAQGQPVTDVQPADLVVREDGMSREILRIVPATEPMQLSLLVDTSGTLANDTNNVREALLAFVKALVPGNEISIVEYGDRPSIVTDSTTTLAALEQGIGRIFPRQGGGAYVLDALVETSRGIQKRESPRPVIVVVDTEGVEFGSAVWDRVLDALTASNAALYVLSLTDGRSGDQSSQEIRSRSIVFDRGPRETGGSKEILLSSLGLKSALAQLANQLTHQVKVIYSRPQALIPPEKVTIEATRSGLKARGTPVRISKGA